MIPLGAATWQTLTDSDQPQPVVGVVPVPPSAKPRRIEVEGLSRVQCEPWRVLRIGGEDVVASYRVAGLAAPGSLSGKVQLLDGQGPKPEPASLHPDCQVLIKQADKWRLRFVDVRDEEYVAPLLSNGRDLRWGSTEVTATYAGPLTGPRGKRTAFLAQVTAYHDLPWVEVTCLWHNADFEHVVGDVYHTGLELQVPPGFVAIEREMVGEHPLELGDILPVQAGRIRRWVVKRVGQESAPVATLELAPDVDGLSWSNPVCQGYLPQGLPVEADKARAKEWADHIDICSMAGMPFDWMGTGSVNGFHVEGSPYGGAGSSYGVERFGDVGLALHGHTRALRQWQTATLNRLPCLLLDEAGHGIDCDRYADSLDRLPWRFSINPNARYTYQGVAGKPNQWKGGKDPFGYVNAPTDDEQAAIASGFVVPHKDLLFSCAAYDRQHWMRALRATLPLAYVAGDRFSVLLLQEHARTARAEHWEGNGDIFHDCRVGALYRQAQDQPRQGLFLGREDCWAIQTVLAARELSSAAFGKPFARWLARYAQAFTRAQMMWAPEGAHQRPGLIQAMDSGKELDYVAGRFAQCQGYQESMLAWAAYGMAQHFGAVDAATTANQAEAMRELHGEAPLYKISVRDLETGETLGNRAQQAAVPFPTETYSQTDFVPALAMMAAAQVWPDPGRRAALLDWARLSLKLPTVEALATWAPGYADQERQAACVGPLAQWLQRHGMLG